MGLGQALNSVGGPAYLLNLDAAADEGISFTLSCEEFVWQLDMPRKAFFGGNLSTSESLRHGDQSVFDVAPGGLIRFPGNKATPRRDRLAFRVAADIQVDSLPGPFLDFFSNYRNFGEYRLGQLKDAGSPASADMHLQPDGRNAFTVLRNWRDRRESRPAFEFVVRELHNAFPGVADDLDFDFAGQSTSLRLVDSKRSETIPAALAPHGWIAGLLHLMAVAGAKPNALISFDEYENSLHPFAIRRLVEAFRSRAAENNLTIILAGHSSALLDEFRQEPSQVYVMEPGQSPLPRRLTDYRDPEWLQQFSLGELYRHEDFGGPQSLQAGSAEAVSSR